mmetsp:Transcript_26014/g.65612  ORF Transcript_26014/g.65612 Transcript_26014/m.65612 type:complete len:327 (+) Transcript_26014:375-1355(+)
MGESLSRWRHPQVRLHDARVATRRVRHPGRRRRAALCRAHSGVGGSARAGVVEELMARLSREDTDSLHALHAALHTLPAEVVAAWHAANDACAPMCLHERLARLTVFLGHFLDAAAMRVLLLGGPPAPGALLSSLTLEPGRRVQRLGAVGASGERVVLTWYLVAEGAEARWRVALVTGEPEGPLPSAPCPEAPPEAVVAASLAALANADMGAVLALSSPANQTAAGGEPAALATLLHASPEHAILLGHSGAALLDARQLSPTRFVALAEVAGAGGAPRAVFAWTLRLQRCPGEACHNCWMTEDVVLVTGCGVDGCGGGGGGGSWQP